MSFDNLYKEYINSLSGDTEFVADSDVENIKLEDWIKINKDFLSERELKVILAHHGIVDGKNRTWEETAELFGVSCGRIRQIESKAFQKPGRIKAHRAMRKLKDVL